MASGSAKRSQEGRKAINGFHLRSSARDHVSLLRVAKEDDARLTTLL